MRSFRQIVAPYAFAVSIQLTCFHDVNGFQGWHCLRPALAEQGLKFNAFKSFVSDCSSSARGVLQEGKQASMANASEQRPSLGLLGVVSHYDSVEIAVCRFSLCSWWVLLQRFCSVSAC